MIILNEIANKLQTILNSNSNPVSYQFLVATSGFHLDRISDRQTGKNVIPVFIGSMGGRFNAIPDLLEEEVNIPVVLYFPVRFKEDFFVLQKYLAEQLVGQYINWGSLTGKAISNISPAQYGELQNIDLKEFKTWVANVYQEEINIMENYLSMQFTLYLSSMASSYLYGNDISVSLGYSNLTDNPTFVQGSMQSNSEPVAQQLLGASIQESEGLAVNTAYGTSFSVYYKSNNFYKGILDAWFGGTIQNTSFTITITLDTKTYTKTCYLQSVNMNIAKGQPITLTFTFSKKVSL